MLSHNHILSPCKSPLPHKNKGKELLWATGHCQLWIMGFAEISKNLYASTGGMQPLGWIGTEQRASEVLEKALISCFPRHGTKLFHLHVDDVRSTAKKSSHKSQDLGKDQ